MRTMNKRYTSVTFITLLSVLIITLALATYAWIRNYFDLRGTDVKTGKLLYDVEVYARDSESRTHTLVATHTVDGSTNRSDPTDHFETAFGTDIDLREEGTSDNPTYDEVFYVIKKLEGSIDLDVSLRFSIEEIAAAGSRAADQNDFLDAIRYNKTSNERVFGDGYWNGVEDNNVNIYDTQSSVIHLLNDTEAVSLVSDRDCCVIRVKFAEKAQSEGAPQLANLHFTLRARLGISQAGAPGEGETDTGAIRITNDAELVDAMSNYRPGQTLRITKNIVHVGDLVFVKPCTVLLDNNVELTVVGNMLFSYRYDGKFAIDLRAGGRILLASQKISTSGGQIEEVGGNLYIDAPYSSFAFHGANNTQPGMADMYIEGTVTVQASVPTQMNEDEVTDGKTYGVTFTRINIHSATSEQAEDMTAVQVEKLDDIMPITVTGETRVYVSTQTRIGALTADEDCNRIIIVNYGTIDAIDLRQMPIDPTFREIDNIYIEHHGKVLGDATIRLPSWAYKRTEDAFTNPNTRIIAHSSGETIYAVSGNHTLAEGPVGNAFFSHGANHEIDDIDYEGRSILVEVLDGDATKILVHYETPTEVTINQFPDRLTYGDGQTVGGSLQSFIDYYSDTDTAVAATGGEHIAPFDQLTEVTVICYGDKVLTSADYAFLRTLTSVTKLDLSEGSSLDDSGTGTPVPGRVPSYAFSNGDTTEVVLPNLTELKMPEYDTVWGMNLFAGCPQLDEIAFPGSLTMLDYINSKNSFAKSKIHYIYTNAICVKGLQPQANRGSSNSDFKFYFTPASVTQEYADLYNGSVETDRDYTAGKLNCGWRFAFAVTDKLGRYGDYFLELDEENRTCKFITYGGAGSSGTSLMDTLNLAEAAIGPYKFDLSSITVDGVRYEITEYADYALTNRLYGTAADITFGNKLTKIGAYAFFEYSSGAETIKNVQFQSDSTLTVGRGAFYNNLKGTLTAPDLKKMDGMQGFSKSLVTEVSMPSLVEMSASGCFAECSKLTKVYLPSLTTVSGLDPLPSVGTTNYFGNRYMGMFYSCNALVTAYMPRLTTLIGPNADSSSYFISSSALKRLDISFIPYINGQNKSSNTFSLGQAVVVVHPEFADEIPEGVTQAVSVSSSGHVFVDAAYAPYYTQRQSPTSSSNGNCPQAVYIDNFDVNNMKTANYGRVDGVIDYDSTPQETTLDVPDLYFYDNGDTTVKLLAYAGPSINTTGDYITPAFFAEADIVITDEQGNVTSSTPGRTLTVTSIEDSAYRNVTMTIAGKLTFPDTITTIGVNAFCSAYNSTKQIYDVDLNRVEEIEFNAFKNNSIYRVYGEYLHTADDYSLASNSKLFFVYLPKLTKNTTKMINATTYSYIFGSGRPENLRFAYTGASPNMYEYYAGADVWLVNCTEETVTESRKIGYGTVMFLNSDVVSNFSTSSTTNVYYAGENFQNLVLADWFDYKVTVNGVEKTMRLPGYVFIPPNSSSAYEMRLESVEKDSITRVCNATGGNYTTPEHLYRLTVPSQSDPAVSVPVIETVGSLTFQAYSTQGTGTADCIVNDIAKYAFQKATLTAIRNLTIGRYTTTIADSLFNGRLTNMTGTLDLQNVVTVGNQSFYNSNKVTALLAPNLETFGTNSSYQSHAFYGMAGLTRLELPKIKKIAKNAFQYCSNLSEVVLGDDCTTIEEYGFGSCGSLKKLTVGKGFTSFATGALDYCYRMETITVLAERPVSFGSCLLDYYRPNNNYYAKQEFGIKVVVSAAYKAAYEAESKKHTYIDKENGNIAYACVNNYIPFDNFTYFDKSTTVDGITYYWAVTEDNTAMISKIEKSDSVVQVVIPDTFVDEGVTYRVTSVSRTAVLDLTGVVELTLPACLQDIDFSAEHLPETLTAIHVSDTAGFDEYRRFTSADGVLYNSDLTVLLMYPAARTTDTFTVPSTVKLIAEGACKGARTLEHVIITGQLDIAGEAFANTSMLHTLTFTATDAADVSRFIGRNTFMGGNGRLRISVDADLLDAFKNHVLLEPSLKELVVCSVVENGVTYHVRVIDENTLYLDGIVLPEAASTSLILPTTLTVNNRPYTVASLSSNAAASLVGITEVTLPANMSRLDFSAQDVPLSVQTFVMDESNVLFKTLDGVIYNEDMTTLLLYPAGKPEQNYALPLSLEVIGEKAFYNVQNLKTLFIGSKVDVRTMAFAYAKSLQYVYFYNVNSAEDVSFFSGANIFYNSTYYCYVRVPSAWYDTFTTATPNAYNVFQRGGFEKYTNLSVSIPEIPTPETPVE